MQRVASFGKKVNPPLPPLPATADQFKPLSPPGMKWMRYREVLRALLRTGRSPHLDPNWTGHPASTPGRWLCHRFPVSMIPKAVNAYPVENKD
jgi:hypothetical protein